VNLPLVAGNNSLRRVVHDRLRLEHVIGLILLAALLTPLLPRISLDTAFADAVVRVTDTGTWPLLAIIALVVVAALTIRPESLARRRTREAVVLAVTLPIALAGNGLMNEHLVKPAFGIPRPNIVSLAEDGVLGPDIPDAETFYAVGDKQDRRDALETLLTPVTTPFLSESIRAHWIHETGYSFPSGHATASVTFAVFIAALGLQWLDGWRRAIAVYVIPVWAITVVYSRPLLEVHTAADVVAGTVAGFLWGVLAFVVVRRAVENQRTAS
jgi:phosphatidylglycerophosphatase B